MKTIITLLIGVLSFSTTFAQIPCNKCPQNINVQMDVDMTETNGRLDYMGQQLYQQKMLLELNNRQNEEIIAALHEGNRLQKKANTTATFNMIFNGVSAVSNVWGNFQTQNTNLLLKDISRRTNQRPVKYINTTTKTTTTNIYNTGGGVGGNTGGFDPGHNQNGNPQGRIRSFL